MKRYFYVLFLISFLFSCSNNFTKETKEKDFSENTKKEMTKAEKMFFGYDESEVYDSSINIKVKAFDEEQLDKFANSLKSLNVKEIGRDEGFREGQMYLTVKAFGNYPETLKKIRQRDEVFYAEPNYKIRLVDSYADGRRNGIIKPFGLLDGNLEKDPEAEKKGYSLAITKALDAYKAFGAGTHEVWAGIVDSGTNANHEDLVYSSGTKVVQILKTGMQANGFPDVTSGNSDIGTSESGAGHGTHCTGIICAVGNNDKGIAGVAWQNVKFASYKGIDNGEGNAQSIYGSLKDLVDTVRAKVSQEVQGTIPVNMSLGGVGATNYAMEHISYALSKGVLPVVASSNDGQILPAYPAAFPGVLTVGASTAADVKAGFSTYGSWLNIVAPGQEIISLRHDSNSRYVYMSGTSMATPFVTGVVTYLLSINPKLTPSQIITILEETADKIDHANQDPVGKYDENGFSLWYGYGRVNVYEAAKMVKYNRVPAPGEKYVDTKLHVEAELGNAPLHIYDGNTGVLVTMALTYGTPAHADIWGLRPGFYKVVYNGVGKDVTIGNTEDVSIKF
ncbi:MAG: S8 family peptidase [Treponema sp.]